MYVCMHACMYMHVCMYVYNIYIYCFTASVKIFNGAALVDTFDFCCFAR